MNLHKIRQAAQSHLIRLLDQSFTSDAPALSEWAFDSDAYLALRAHIQRLTAQDALKAIAWLQQSDLDDELPEALRIRYAVAHTRYLPPPPDDYHLLLVSSPTDVPRPASPVSPPQASMRPAPVMPPPPPDPSPSPAPVHQTEAALPLTPSVPPPPTTPLYHFTDARNLHSIRRYGLLPWPYLRARHITFFPASNRLSRHLDVSRDLQDYVRLSLRPDHPMSYIAKREGRLTNLVWLQVDGIVTTWKTTLFSDRNAASPKAVVNTDWRTAFESDDPQAEVLVRDGVPPHLITFPPN